MTILEHDIVMTDDLRRVPRQELEDRLRRFRAAMTEKDADWQLAVISDKLNMYYFTGTMQEGAFLIRPQDAILWVRRSLERARNESLLPVEQIRPMHSYRQVSACYEDALPTTIYLDKKHTTLDWLGFFNKYFHCQDYRDMDPVLAALRSVKSPYELELMRFSGRLHEQALVQEAPKLLREGISEAELAVQLYLKMVLAGSQGIARTNRPTGEDVIGLASFGKSALVRTAFDGPGGTGGTCVAVQSIGSAFRFLKPGRLVYLDIPCGFDGYNTDKTVVYYYGDLDADPEKETILQAYNYCVALEKKTAALMKPGAYIVNTARGDLIDTWALIDALRAKKLGGAVLDVIEDESGYYYTDARQKPVPEHIAALEELPEVTLLQHMAFCTYLSANEQLKTAIEASYLALSGKPNPYEIK